MSHSFQNLVQDFTISCDREVDTYLKSLPYFMLTGRKGLKLYQDGSAKLYLCIHPHDEKTILVFPEENGNGDLTVGILNKLSKTNYNVQLARYNEEHIVKLEEALRRNPRNFVESINIKKEDILDWQYPVRILDTSLVSQMRGKSFSKLRNKFNKVSNDFEILPLSSPLAIRAIRSMILSWAAGIIYVGNETGHDMTEFYDTLVKHIQDFPSLFDGFVIVTDKQPLGFSIWDYSENAANALAGLNLRSIPGMSEFQIVTACKILYEKGILEYNLGGSESIELDEYKLKFRPKRSITLISLDVNFRSFAEKNLITTNTIESADPEFNNL